MSTTAQEEIAAESFAEWMQQYVDSIALADLSPAMEQIGETLRRGFAAAFLAERGPDGPWEPRKIDVGLLRGEFPESFNRPLLIYTGDLFNATAVRGSPGQINQIEPQSITVGVSGEEIPYAETHQFGDRVYLPDILREIDIPARPYVYATEQTIDQAEEQLVDFLMRNIL